MIRWYDSRFGGGRGISDGMSRHESTVTVYRRLLRMGLLVWCLAAGSAHAQESTVEFWPEIDVWMRVSPAWRLSLFVPIAKNIETKYREGNIVAQVDYAWGRTKYDRRLLDESRAQKMKLFLVRGGYLSGKSLGDGGDAYKERTALAELHVRVPLKGNILLSHRLRADLRWLGDDAAFSQRWRYRLMVEKEYTAGRRSLVPYVNVEPYFDSRYDTVNRIRLIGGATISWIPRIAIEGNWTYQYDSRSSVTYTNALNIILHVFFETKASRPAVVMQEGAWTGRIDSDPALHRIQVVR